LKQAAYHQALELATAGKASMNEGALAIAG
jgi:hypothetical protein